MEDEISIEVKTIETDDFCMDIIFSPSVPWLDVNECVERIKDLDNKSSILLRNDVESPFHAMVYPKNDSFSVWLSDYAYIDIVINQSTFLFDGILIVLPHRDERLTKWLKPIIEKAFDDIDVKEILKEQFDKLISTLIQKTESDLLILKNTIA